MPTAAVIHEYSLQRSHLRAAIEKMIEKNPLKGHEKDNVICDRWDTNL